MGDSRLKPDESRLERAGLTPAGPGLWTRGPLDAVLARMAKTDLFISDFDECMFPHITQAEAARAVFRRVLEGRDVPDRFALSVRMSFHAIILIARKAYQEKTGNIHNSKLIKTFERFVKGVPLEYFEEAADTLNEDYFPGAPEAFEVFTARNVPVGVISLGLDIIIRRLLAHIENTRGVKFDFYDCTRVLADSRGRFAGYDPEKTYTENEAKRTLLRARCEQYGAKHCLVVGHDRDDLKLLEEARRLGGVAIGFRPVPETYPLLDAALFAPDWKPLADFFSSALNSSI